VSKFARRDQILKTPRKVKDRLLISCATVLELRVFRPVEAGLSEPGLSDQQPENPECAATI
jgi:hypothetical protein